MFGKKKVYAVMEESWDLYCYDESNDWRTTIGIFKNRRSAEEFILEEIGRYDPSDEVFPSHRTVPGDVRVDSTCVRTDDCTGRLMQYEYWIQEFDLQ